MTCLRGEFWRQPNIFDRTYSFFRIYYFYYYLQEKFLDPLWSEKDPPSTLFILGATKKICTFILTVENFSKSYFRKCPNYWKSKNPEISEVIILRNLSKINNFFISTQCAIDLMMIMFYWTIFTKNSQLF